MHYSHVSVLLDTTVDLLQPTDGKAYVDATVGGGGHAEAILERSGPGGRLLGLDADPGGVELATERLRRFGPRATIVRESFDLLEGVARVHGFVPAAGVVFDLGASSMQLDQADRGFSFRLDAPLDMRFDPNQPTSAADLVNGATEAELADWLFRFGEEPAARRIARAIVRRRVERRIETTADLAGLVTRAVGRPTGRIHPATRVFQALRIAVNRELDRLASALPRALEILEPGGRIAVISFHSLEDRIVKQYFAREARGCICPPEVPVCICGHAPRLRPVTRKPIVPDAREVEHNPRSRSAKLRVAEKVAPP